MKVIKVSATFGGKVNLGNYENFEVNVSVEAELEEGETLEAVTHQLFNNVREEARREVATLDSRMTAGWLRATALKPEDVNLQDNPAF